MKKLFLLSLPVIIGLMSCSKSDDAPNNEVSGAYKKRLSEYSNTLIKYNGDSIIFDNGYRISYPYYQNGKLKGVKYSYDGNVNNAISAYEFTYENGKIIKVKSNDLSAINPDSHYYLTTIEYDNKGNISKTRGYEVSNGEMKLQYGSELKWSDNRNLIELKEANDPVAIIANNYNSITTYQYDTKINPCKTVNSNNHLLPLLFTYDGAVPFSTNNVTLKTTLYKNEYGEFVEGARYEYTYVYDIDGFPSSIAYVINDRGHVLNFSWNYKYIAN